MVCPQIISTDVDVSSCKTTQRGLLAWLEAHREAMMPLPRVATPAWEMMSRHRLGTCLPIPARASPLRASVFVPRYCFGDSFRITSSRLKLAGFCRIGKS
jgi:hypothetical protein